MPKLLNDDSIRKMTTHGVREGRARVWNVNTVPNWWHTGSLSGTSTIMVHTTGVAAGQDCSTVAKKVSVLRRRCEAPGPAQPNAKHFAHFLFNAMFSPRCRMDWLQTLHQKWMNSRKRRVTPSMRSRLVDWEDLLDAAGLKTAEERQAAARDAEKIPQLKLHRLKGRPHIVLKIEVPVESEEWLHAKFGSQPGAEAQRAALAVVEGFEVKPHPLLPDAWSALLSRLKAEFAIPRAVEPFRWRDAGRVDELLKLLFDLTAREWPEATLIRDASTQIGLDSKYLEARQSVIERALALLFDRETPLEALGIQTSNSVLHYSGPLVLHFADHSKAVDLRFESTLSVAELERATHVTTSAQQLLTVENRKTTFLQLARADASRSTLIVATSFPTQAVRLLLEKLPSDLPHHHFGDTDAAGWDILRKLRDVSGRTVHPFHMHWRPQAGASPLTQRDQQILSRLLSDPGMNDCHADLHAMREAGNKGSFEQESLGRPDFEQWPFYGP